MPDLSLLIDSGKNLLLNDSLEIDKETKGVLTFNVPGNRNNEFIITFVVGMRIPVRDPLTVVRMNFFKLYRPEDPGRAVDILGQGEPYWEEVFGTAQLQALLAAKERIAGGTKIEIGLENLDDTNSITASVTLIGEILSAERG